MEGTENKTGKRVLIVTNEATLTYFLAFSIKGEQESWDVFTAHDAEKALERKEEKAFDLLISDIVLRLLSGFSLTEEVKKRWPKIKVILMTQYGSPEVRERATQVGADSYIEKPFVFSRLWELIRQVLQETEIILTP